MDGSSALAEAGIDLALAQDAAACCERLEQWAIDLTGARAAIARHDDDRSSSAAAPESGAIGDSWHVFPVRPDPSDPAEPWSTWTAELAIDSPTSPGWEEVVEILVRQASVGFVRVASRAALSRHDRQQRALVEAGKALSGERTLDGVLSRIVEHAAELTGARYGAIGVLDESGERLDAFVTVGIDPETHARIGDLPTGRGVLGVLITDPRPLRLRRISDHPKSVGFPANHPPMTSFLGVPIVTAHGVAGRIYLTEKQDADVFSDEDEQLALTLASQAAIAIDNASLNDELRRTAADLQAASEHKSAFLANVSHELRSPLNTIVGYSRLLLDDPRGLDEEQLEDLRIVRGSSEHLLALITDLLDLQRIEAGRVRLERSDVDVAEVVRDAAAGIRPMLHDGVQLDIVERVGSTGATVFVDATRIRQVVLNVLGNAAKFTEAGSIIVTTTGHADRVEVVVEDTGPGIAPADRSKIFESFYQSRAAISRSPTPREGVGLGLAITRLLVELHGGRVGLTSTVGEGTTIMITLPRNVDAP